MKKLKAVVLEKKGAKCNVLASDGSFQRVRYNKSVEIGEEIEINVGRDFSSLRLIAGVAALFLLVFMATMGWSLFQAPTAVAMMSVDINPSIELTVDAKGRVMNLDSKNKDAEQLVQGLQLKGQTWGQAVTQVVQQAVALNYLNPEHTWILVGYTNLQEGGIQLKGMGEQEIASLVTDASQAKGLNVKVAIYQLNSNEGNLAKAKGLTLGEYALMKTAEQAGMPVGVEALKDSAQRSKLLEQPQLQMKMRTDKNLHEGQPQKEKDEEKHEDQSDKDKNKIIPPGQEQNNQGKGNGGMMSGQRSGDTSNESEHDAFANSRGNGRENHKEYDKEDNEDNKNYKGRQD